MSGASTPLRDEVPHGPLTVSVQDIFDGIVLDASQLNLMLSLGEKVGDQVISEDEEQEDSDREDEGEFSEDNTRGSSEELGGVIETEEDDQNEGKSGWKSDMGCMGVSQTKTAIVTPFDQAWELTKTVPVRVGHVVTINSEGSKQIRRSRQLERTENGKVE